MDCLDGGSVMRAFWGLTRPDSLHMYAGGPGEGRVTASHLSQLFGMDQSVFENIQLKLDLPDHVKEALPMPSVMLRNSWCMNKYEELQYEIMDQAKKDSEKRLTRESGIREDLSKPLYELTSDCELAIGERESMN